MGSVLAAKAQRPPTTEEIPWQGNDVMWTTDQIDQLEEQGLDTTGFLVDDKGRFGKWKKKKTNKNKNPNGKGTVLM